MADPTFLLASWALRRQAVLARQEFGAGAASDPRPPTAQARGSAMTWPWDDPRRHALPAAAARDPGQRRDAAVEPSGGAGHAGPALGCPDRTAAYSAASACCWPAARHGSGWDRASGPATCQRPPRSGLTDISRDDVRDEQVAECVHGHVHLRPRLRLTPSWPARVPLLASSAGCGCRWPPSTPPVARRPGEPKACRSCASVSKHPATNQRCDC